MVYDVTGGSTDKLSPHDIMTCCGLVGANPNVRELSALQHLHSRYRVAMSKPQKLQQAKTTDVEATKALLGLKPKKNG